MRRFKFLIYGLIALGVVQIVSTVIFLTGTVFTAITNDIFEFYGEVESGFIAFTLPLVIGWIKTFVTLVMSGLTIIGGAQILLLLLNKQQNSLSH